MSGRVWVTSAALFALLGFCTASSANQVACPSLEDCLAELRILAKTRRAPDGLGEEGRASIRHIRSFEGATEALAALLSDPDRGLAELAAFGLQETPRIDPSHLPQIIAGLDRGLGWLPPALARIDSDEAAREAVARFAVSEGAPHNEEGHAVSLLGARAVPYLIEAARRPESRHYALAHALREMGAVGIAAAVALMEIARDQSLPDAISHNVLDMIAQLKGAPVEDELVELRRQRPELAVWIDEALVGIGSRRAGAILAQQLRQESGEGPLGAGVTRVSFQRFAEAGASGHDGGPALVEVLEGDDWDSRLYAARALGFIGYGPAVVPLVTALQQPDDVRLSWAAAESLGRLGQASAATALQEVAERHWHPKVREAAATALRHLRDGTGYPAPSRRPEMDGDFVFYSAQKLGDESTCGKWKAPIFEESRRSKLYSRRDKRRLETLAFDVEILSYRTTDETDSPAARDEVALTAPRRIVEQWTLQRQVPHVALRVDGGWLVGTDRGEWGGELAFVGDDDSRTVIVDAGVEDIHRLDDRVVVVSGDAHMRNRGMVLRVSRDANGRWAATNWRRLPGAPTASWPTREGQLFIAVIGGDGLLLAADGRMRMAECVR